MFTAIEYEDQVYINAHCEETLLSLFSDNSVSAVESGFSSELGVYLKTLSQRTINSMITYCKRYREKQIIICMKHILGLGKNESNVFEKLLYNLQYANMVVLFDVSKEICDIIMGFDMPDTKFYFDESRNNYVLLIGTVYDGRLQDSYWVKMEQKVFDEKLENRIIGCCRDFGEKSFSSRIKLSKYVNIKEIIESHSFFCYCVYRMVMKSEQRGLVSIVSKANNSNIVVLAHTMNGVAIGSLFSQMLALDFLFIDHLGPLNKVYMDSFAEELQPNKTYLITCDVVCMGTELSAAKAILDVFGAKKREIISFVDVDTINETQRDITALYRISEENNPMGYKILTALR